MDISGGLFDFGWAWIGPILSTKKLVWDGRVGALTQLKNNITLDLI